MNRRLATVFVLTALLAVIACSSSDPYDQPPQTYGGRPPMGGGEGGGSRGGAADVGAQMVGNGLDLLAEASWWRDPRIATEVAVTPDQVTALDKIESEHSMEIARLLHDTQMSMRELRDALNAEPANEEAIFAAGKRVRDMRDTTLDHVVKMLVAERQLLSHQQWTTLQSAMQERRQQRQQERGNGGRGGRGGFGGGMGGRRPGGF